MIPVFTLARQNKIIDRELQQAIEEVINGGVYILGPKVTEFEKAFAKYLNVKYAIGVASGTDALSLAFLAVGVKVGDEVIVQANSYPTVFAITTIGAIPRLVDIDPISFNIDPTKILPAITKKTKAIIAVHLYGQPADLTSVRQCLKEVGRKIFLIEDCAQAHGAEVRIQKSLKSLKEEEIEWKKVGTVGDIGCFSFYPTKNLGCFGDGGMVVTNNEEIAERVKLLRMYGEEKRYQSIILGRNSRLDELQAAILLVKVKYLDRWNERRRKIAELYKSQLKFCTFPKTTSDGDPKGLLRGEGSSKSSTVRGVLRTPRRCHNLKVQNFSYQLTYENTAKANKSDIKHVYHLFVIRSKKRDELKNYLKKQDIQTAIHYPSPIHLQPSFKFLGYKEGDFPESEKACREILSLPMFPELKDGEVDFVIKQLREFYSI